MIANTQETIVDHTAKRTPVVRFAPYNMTAFVFKIDKSENQDVWMTNEDLHDVVADCHRVVHMYETGVLEDKDPALRGLESRTSHGAYMRMRVRNQARRALLREQHRQKLAHEYNDKKLADAYSRYTCFSAVEAMIRAQEDRIAVSQDLSANDGKHMIQLTQHCSKPCKRKPRRITKKSKGPATASIGISASLRGQHLTTSQITSGRLIVI